MVTGSYLSYEKICFGFNGGVGFGFTWRSQGERGECA